MKTLATPLANHYASGSYTLAICLRVQRRDGNVYRWTSHDRDLTVAAEVYRAGPGLDFSNVAQSVGFAPDNLELQILYADEAVTRDDLLAGRWDDASYRLFEVDYTNTSAVNVLSTGTTGEAKITRESGFTIELRSLKQRLQKTVGVVTQRTCRYRLGSAACGVDLGPYTMADVVVTSVDSARVFSSSTLGGGSPAAADDYYKDGTVTFTSGDNVGVSRKVKTSAGASVSVVAAFPAAIQVGDTFTIVAGCQKRFEEDCVTKFDNGLNFGGEPHLPGVDRQTAAPDVG